MNLKGTDYYIVKRSLIESKNAIKRYLGRSVSGWCFFIHIHPRDGIYDWGDMRKYLEKSVNLGFVIVNSHNMVVELNNFINIVTNRQRIYLPKREPDWYTENFAKQGPHGLARRKVDGYLCMGNGKGCYDYMTTDFFWDS